jgi:hypothetical protein
LLSINCCDYEPYLGFYLFVHRFSLFSITGVGSFGALILCFLRFQLVISMDLGPLYRVHSELRFCFSHELVNRREWIWKLGIRISTKFRGVSSSV